jgi:Cys-tRNA synthase (O-phospho-L-seryl-tRNA:Cys-tRNA synthase)
MVHFLTIYRACKKTLLSIKEHEPLETVTIDLEYPVTDAEIVRALRETIKRVKGEDKNVRLAMFDTVLTFPGVRMPWEEMVAVCKQMNVLSLIDGAHGIGQIDLTHLGKIGSDFFVSNCHKYVSWFDMIMERVLVRMKVALHTTRLCSLPRSIPESTSHPYLHTYLSRLPTSRFQA